ncbi:hypothetical protein VRU48_05250 [Pedobacter sp. KR3-3]|uniref:Uncharacterized protein n=1 Tax=Pedobacter albus TaxID=3113905 RepID=A0ABU7I4X5_9SPHI|nr:hypothetical protein [Pedobacter sp. KR3-3]MEE1944504.1 hypothetical protein [Pedobacter sp. KR3-3]
MNEMNYILNTPPPLSQNFKLLKDEGLRYIQQHVDTEWTNLNDSDPGITILEQLCFALTELGYCNNFTIADILTQESGRLQVTDQFYRPQEILTTSPVTLNDYRRYLIDLMPALRNVQVFPLHPSAFMQGVYSVYLLLDETAQYNAKALCNEAYFALQQRRNLGEVFLMPQVMPAKKHFITGVIVIEADKNQQEILANLDRRIADFIFPKAKQQGNKNLSEQEVSSNEIFNGPQLANGWILDEDLGDHQTTLSLVQLMQLIEGTEGVVAVSDLSLDGLENLRLIAENAWCVMKIDWQQSLANGLTIQVKGRPLALANSVFEIDPTASLQGKVNPIVVAESTEIEGLPKSKFRDIGSYYSIQNTFPEIYAVGHDAIITNATPFQIAQSKQLKGYLTLFDQVLANQFAQLANVGTLFSFKNAQSALPADLENFHAHQSVYQKANQLYPAPYQSFAPTYFGQSVYDIPNIRGLLKNNQIFNYGIELETSKELDEKSWTAYKKDPYNPYIRGLMNLTATDEVDLPRRNEMLDHLLARHGESPMLIDQLIAGASYTGEKVKDTLIIKSLYLQNLGLLSYFKPKAYNFLIAEKLSDALPEKSAHQRCELFGRYAKDFLVDSGKIDAIEKLKPIDFSNYAALELKLNLLFGLNAHYNSFVTSYFDEEQALAAIRLSFWLSQYRKGFMMVERNLLLQQLQYNLVLKEEATGRLLQLVKILDFEQATRLNEALILSTDEIWVNGFNHQTLALAGHAYRLEPVNAVLSETAFKPASSGKYSLQIAVAHGGLKTPADFDVFENSIHVFFPAFIPAFNTPEFKQKLELFLTLELPLHVAFHCHFINEKLMEVLIPEFVHWHNEMNHNRAHEKTQGRREKAEKLLNLITLIQ